MTETKSPYASHYSKLFENHPWLAHFLVHVVKRILGIVIEWIDKEAKPHLRK
jgi:hypothetical protein